MKNNFLLDVDQYQQHLSPLQDWAKQTAWHASKVTGKPYEKCLAHLQAKLRAGKVHITDPIVTFYHRQENGDREKAVLPLTRYLGRAVKDKNVIAPTGTTYLHPSVKASLIVGYVDFNKEARSKLKKLAQKYEFEGNEDLTLYYNNGQDNKKRTNNAVSGCFVAEGSVIQNKSGHSTLTSITRTIASLSNASNERILAGNRHYYKPDIVLNNIVSICQNTNYEVLKAAIETYQLKYPSIEETINCVTHSSDLYYRDTRKTKEIKNFIEKLLPEERAAFVYTGDLYHLRTLNPEFMRRFITDLSARGDTEPVDDVRKAIHKFDEQVVNFAHQVNISMMAGKGKDYDKLCDEEAYILYNTCKNIDNAIEKYKLFIQAFLLTVNHPPNVAQIQNMIRRAVVLSDTDSTMFSVDDWVSWYFGDLRFNDDSYAVAGSMMYMATQSIAHILACFSANMNTEKQRLFTLAMKPEFVFPVFGQTSVAKHYFTAMLVKEGQVYDKIKMEIKGVHMKDSTVPGNIIKDAATDMREIIEGVMAGKGLDLASLLKKTIDTEQLLIKSLLSGEVTYFKRIKIKDRAAYKLGAEKLKEGEADKTNYRHYTCWETCFAPIYGSIPPPPYSAISVPLNLPSKTALLKWLSGLEDRAFAARFSAWLDSNNMARIGQIHLPIEFCQNNGIPKELIPVLDVKRIVLTLTRVYRNMVETFGYFSKPSMMISEQVVLIDKQDNIERKPCPASSPASN